jgi:hypothetical protein
MGGHRPTLQSNSHQQKMEDGQSPKGIRNEFSSHFPSFIPTSPLSLLLLAFFLFFWLAPIIERANETNRSQVQFVSRKN